MNPHWHKKYKSLEPIRNQVAHPIFLAGLSALKISSQQIPDISLINLRLFELSEFEAIPVIEQPETWDYFSALSRKQIYIFYAPNDPTKHLRTFFDVYGRLPLIADPAIAEIVQAFGDRIASNYLDKKMVTPLIKRFHDFLDFTVMKNGNTFMGLGAALMVPTNDEIPNMNSEFLRLNLNKYNVIDETGLDFQMTQIPS